MNHYMETHQYINIVLESCGVFFCFLAVTVIAVGFYVNKHIRNYTVLFFCCLFVILSSDIVEIVLDSFHVEGGLPYRRIFNFVENLFVYILSYLFLMFLVYLMKVVEVRRIAQIKQFFIGMGKILLLTEILLLCLSQVFGIIYFFDLDGIYRRGSMYMLPQICLVAFLFMDAFLLVRCWRQLPYKILIPLCCCILFPLLAIGFQIVFPEYRFLLFSHILSSIMVLVFAFYVQVGKYVANEKQLADMQSAMMLSQIQPHFLHNALVSIAQLCEKNPKSAKKAIITFSEYLRENMESLKEKDPIPFSKELEHLKNYLYLEHLRFGEDLKTKLDIQAVDFLVPVLSLQPLVENAIRHGVGMREEGGTVVVSSRDAGDYFEIRVWDNGVGFDTSKEIRDRREHIGLKNVERRLRSQCGGQLKVVSIPGRGTTVTILIPKEVSGYENISGR